MIVCGCAHAIGPTPSTAGRSWLAASSRDDPHAAYRLLSRSARESLSESEFVKRWRATVEERKGQLAALGPATQQAPSEHAQGLWSDGRQTELKREPDG